MTRHFPHDWQSANVSRIPYPLYTDEDVYRRELEAIFYGPHWSYVGLSCEISGPGDYKETSIGERSVIMVRDPDGSINVVENHCAHRGVKFCQERFGTVKSFICPYHQWNYNLKGDLTGLPFRRGFKGQGGMPADFDTKQHGLTKLHVAEHNGVVFATFSADTPPLLDYIGPKILEWFERTFDGRELTLLGYSRQRIPGNWKLMQENIKDPYHPGLLHTWFVTFGLWRADQSSRMIMDEHGRHAAMVSAKNAGGGGEVTQNVSSFKADMALNDDRMLDIVPEEWWKGPTVVMTTIFPSLILQQQVNSVSTRQIQPRGPGKFDFVWTHFGFKDDTPEMTRRRLRQANLFGPAGFVSADDGEVIEFSQQGFEQDPANETYAELGGTDVADTEHMVTETLIRGMYGYYRKVMDL
ncbi:salicylate 5-hydroxylase large subunit [Sphingomonas vulcanisoli]|uniref:Salicylate 5-hydroxylase large subunit n=1 Tax=Sphingomonas vulcanisoli TaxID=1658060 RepID=A0ABX0TUU1_9SPHN|nr:aromatic ring-hydroxylating dioxygenase subunit alpha [Sphingomonas vulcanisoli]NIJ09287.1 salicylate 5-hydroxylase large subunit [Sphingomonas vulcanisoli]